MKKIREVSKLSGVTKRTLQYYDDEGVLTARRTEDNHRLYDEDSLRKLCEILVYREIGLGLEEIKLILGLDDIRRNQLLDRRISLMQEIRNELEETIRFAEVIREKGIPEFFPEEAARNNMTYVEYIRHTKEKISSESGITEKSNPEKK